MKPLMTGPFRRRIIPALALWLALCSASTLAAVDFIRGDANNDGVVTLADAHRIFTFLFRTGKGVTCRDAADADNNGTVDISDAVRILGFIDRRDPSPEAPFPDPGPDDGSGKGCDSYGGESPLEDAKARLEVIDAVASGGEDRHAIIRLAISNSTRLAGYHAVLETGGIFEDRDLNHDYRYGLFDLTGTLFGHITARSDGAEGKLIISFLSNFSGDLGIPPRENQHALEVHLCLKPDVPAGDYPLVIESGELIDFDSGRRIDPALVPGRFTVLEPVAPSGCAIAPSNPVGGRFLDVAFKLGDASGTPGSEVVVPFFIRASDHVRTHGINLSIDFDEEVLQLAGIDTVLPRPDGKPWKRGNAMINNLNAVPGSAGVDEGFVIGEYLYGSWGEVVESASLFFPANEEFTALNLRFRIDPGAPVGSTEVRFLDGAEKCSSILGNPYCYPWNNEIISLQLELRPELVNSFLFVNGKVNIIGEVTTFIRGDSNGDLEVEIADAVFTLEHLFLGGPPPACPDAADANDDGLLDLSDPIATLAASFLGAGPLPPPAGAPGRDPTPDALGACFPASR